MNAFIRSVATANPARYATSQEVHDFLVAHFPMTPAERDLYGRILLNGPIRGRYVAVEHDEQAAQLSPDELASRFCTFGRRIAAEAAGKTLAAAGLAAADVDGLVVNTCTGYLCPGLSSYVAQDLGLRPCVRVMDLMGMGCGAAIPNLQCAAGMLATGAGTVLSVAVEICSSTLFMGADPQLIVSNSIFGDGAAAAVVTADVGPVRLVDFETCIRPEYRDELRYRTEDGRLRNVLSRRVPVIGAATIKEAVGGLLQRQGLTPGQIDWWAVHPGGSAVLEQVGKKLALPPSALWASHEVLRDYGNMSSPSVLFVLQKMLQASPPPRGRGMLLAFGAGFSAFAALAEA